jgi:glycosyltransferase involved in cell wall biosynthesis
MKIAVICRGSQTFLNPLIKHWLDCGHILITDEKEIGKADVIFCEWANEQSVEIIWKTVGKKVVIRMHGSEYYQGFHNLWNIQKLAAVICANPDYVIPNVNVINCALPIDTNFWKPNKSVKKIPRKLLMVGSFCYSKGHVALLNFILDNPDFFSDISFVGCIEPKDDPVRACETKKVIAEIVHLSSKYNLPVKIKNEMTRESLRKEYQSAEYIVSNSVNEGFHLSIIEGVLCDCKPLIHDWIGADKIYPESLIYSSAKEFWNLIGHYPSVKARELQTFIMDNWNEEKIFATIDNTLLDAARENM